VSPVRPLGAVSADPARPMVLIAVTHTLKLNCREYRTRRFIFMSERYSDAKTIAAFYDRMAGRYIHRTHSSFLDVVELQELAGTELRNKHVLDLGCGVGRVARFVEGRAAFCCGIDLSKEMIRAANRIGLRDCCFACADASRLPFSGPRFDIVTSFGLFEYVEDLSPFLERVADVLTERGVLVFTCHTPSGAAYFNRFGEYRRVGHNPEKVREVCEAADFDVISMRPALADMRTLTLSVRVARLLPFDALRDRTLKVLASVDHMLCSHGSFASTARMLVVHCLKKENGRCPAFVAPGTAIN
jgi:SAM-dependent methyltransferase